MIKSFASVLLALALTTYAHAANGRAALLAVECESIDGMCQVQHLVRFHFANGALIGKDEILATSNVRFDLGKNRIDRNRYVITEWGDVVDVEQKKVLHKSLGSYVATEGDRIIQLVNRVDAEGYFFYDIKSGEYARLDAPGKFALPGALAPGGTKSADADGFEIWLHELNGGKRLLGTRFSWLADPRSSDIAGPPLFWLDDNRILTQRKNGELVILHLDRSVTPLVRIPLRGPSLIRPSLYKDAEGRIVYESNDRAFVIDVANKRYAPYPWLAIGDGFEVEIDRNASYGHVVRYDGKEIGRLWGSVHLAPTTDGFVAIEYGDVGSNLGYPKGIKVWSSASREWTTIDLPWVTAIIGWLEE